MDTIPKWESKILGWTVVIRAAATNPKGEVRTCVVTAHTKDGHAQIDSVTSAETCGESWTLLTKCQLIRGPFQLVQKGVLVLPASSHGSGAAVTALLSFAWHWLEVRIGSWTAFELFLIAGCIPFTMSLCTFLAGGNFP